MPIMAVPALRITDTTSAMSMLIWPGLVMMSDMPCKGQRGQQHQGQSPGGGGDGSLKGLHEALPALPGSWRRDKGLVCSAGTQLPRPARLLLGRQQSQVDLHSHGGNS